MSVRLSRCFVAKHESKAVVRQREPSSNSDWPWWCSHWWQGKPRAKRPNSKSVILLVSLPSAVVGNCVRRLLLVTLTNSSGERWPKLAGGSKLPTPCLHTNFPSLCDQPIPRRATPLWRQFLTRASQRASVSVRGCCGSSIDPSLPAYPAFRSSREVLVERCRSLADGFVRSWQYLV